MDEPIGFCCGQPIQHNEAFMLMKCMVCGKTQQCLACMMDLNDAGIA